MGPPFDATPLMRLYARRRLAVLARQDAVEAQRRQLFELLRRAAHTRFGRAHGFASIREVEQFQARVPLRRYDDFRAEWWRGFPVLDDAGWPGRVPYFAFTSGTSSNSAKYIPVTRDMLRANRRAALEVLVHHLAARPKSRVMGGVSFMLGGSTDLAELAPGVLRGDLSGIAANEVPGYLRPWIAPPREAALDPDWERKLDTLAKLAAGQDVRALSGTPGWLLLFLERIGVLWPGLELLVHGGVGFRPYAERFARLLAGTKAETREVYPASEGFVAVADAAPGQGLRLLADNGLFFEFVPPAQLDRPAPERRWLGNAETGVDYALVLSSNAGLWAYVLGDVVRLVSLSPPRLLVAGRTSYQLNVFGEHLSGEQLEDAVLAMGGEVADFAVLATFEGTLGRHVFVVEFARPVDVGPAARLLDEALCRGSLDYRERRAGGIGLLPPELRPVPPGFFAAWMKRHGKLGGQHKVPRVVTDEAMAAELLQLSQ